MKHYGGCVLGTPDAPEKKPAVVNAASGFYVEGVRYDDWHVAVAAADAALDRDTRIFNTFSGSQE